MFEYWLLIILCSISLSQILLILFFLLVKKKGSNVHKVMISVLFIVWSIFVAGSLILLLPLRNLYLQDLGHLMNLTIFLVAPLLYIYFSKLFKTDFVFDFKSLVHALPFVVIFLYSFNRIVIENDLFFVFTPTAIVLLTFLFIQNIVYFFLILKDIKNLQKGSRDRSKLKLFRFLLTATTILFLIKLIIFIIWNILRYNELCIFVTSIFFGVVFIIVNSVVIFSLNYPELLVGSFKYQRSSINTKDLEDYISKITDFLTHEQAFTDPLFTLERLAKKLRVQKNLISQVINESSGLNFNDFINRYRIDFAQDLFRSDKEKNILEIAYLSGFNSKTTFNNSFKKFTGKTPKEFKKSLLN